MEYASVLLPLGLSAIVGAIVGLERELNEKQFYKKGEQPHALLGLRTFSLVSLLGCISGFLFKDYQGLSLLLAGSTFAVFLAFYIINTLQSKDAGITTELALIFSFIVGVLLATAIFPVHITLALSVILILILSRKRKIKDVVEDIHTGELNAFIAYAIIALVILPFLPNTSYSISDFPALVQLFESFGLNIDKLASIELINPFKVWMIVALITGIDLLGYIMERSVGQKKGWIFTSMAGGFVSSTATTQSLAQQSKTSKGVHHLLSAALVANLVSFLQVGILLSPINAEFVVKLIPTFIGMIVVCLCAIFYFLKAREEVVELNSKSQEENISKDERILDIGPALKFAGLYLMISIFSSIALEFFGNTAFLITTGVGALAGLDAVMINTAQLAGSKIDFTLAIWAFIIANAVNLFGKSFYSYLQGKRDFAIKFTICMSLVVASSLIGLFFV